MKKEIEFMEKETQSHGESHEILKNQKAEIDEKMEKLSTKFANLQINREDLEKK